MKKSFDELWQFVIGRRQRADDPVTLVQHRDEMEHVWNLSRGCESYLEIGTAEGNSLYMMAHELGGEGFVAYVDLAEPHTGKKRKEVLDILQKKQKRAVRGFHGRSDDQEIVKSVSQMGKVDCVMIDAGHSYKETITDAINYGFLAKKYIFFHDITMPEVRRAFDEYVLARGFKKVHTFIKSKKFGYGIIEL